MAKTALKTKIIPCLILTIGLGQIYPAQAIASGFKPAILNEENKQLVASVENDLKQNASMLSAECADPANEGSLGREQAEVMDDQKKMATHSIDMGSTFDLGKKSGCFAALSDFPDLSLTIPSLTGIVDSIKKTLVNYATRKVCEAVNEAFAEMLNPLRDAIDNLNERGQLDLSGQVNATISKQLYEIDPELGRVNRPAQSQDEIEFKW